MKVSPQSTPLKSNKFLVIGDSQCGKTSIINYYCNPDRSPQKVPKTIGCDIHMTELPIKTEEQVTYEYIEFWDVSADTIPEPILQAYLQSMVKDIDQFKGVIFFFDTFNIKSFLRIRKYIEEVVLYLLEQKETLASQGTEPTSIPLLLIGNKRDLLDDESAEKKISTIRGYLELMFEENVKINCEFLSLKYSFSQFRGLEDFIRTAIGGENSNLHLYRRSQAYYSYDKLAQYTKELLLSFGADLTRMKDYLFLQKTNLSTFVSTLVETPPKMLDVSKFLWRE